MLEPSTHRRARYESSSTGPRRVCEMNLINRLGTCKHDEMLVSRHRVRLLNEINTISLLRVAGKGHMVAHVSRHLHRKLLLYCHSR